jgi:hypothetical protein
VVTTKEVVFLTGLLEEIASELRGRVGHYLFQVEAFYVNQPNIAVKSPMGWVTVLALVLQDGVIGIQKDYSRRRDTTKPSVSIDDPQMIDKLIMIVKESLLRALCVMTRVW